VVTDTAYLLFAVGLLRDRHPEAARALTRTILGGGLSVVGRSVQP
jgi:hypothetical protein